MIKDNKGACDSVSSKLSCNPEYRCQAVENISTIQTRV